MAHGSLEVGRNQTILRFLEQDQEPGFYLKAVGSHQMVLSRGVTILWGFEKTILMLEGPGWTCREELEGIHSRVARIDGGLGKVNSHRDRERWEDWKAAEEKCSNSRGFIYEMSIPIVSHQNCWERSMTPTVDISQFSVVRNGTNAYAVFGGQRGISVL